MLMLSHLQQRSRVSFFDDVGAVVWIVVSGRKNFFVVLGEYQPPILWAASQKKPHENIDRTSANGSKQKQGLGKALPNKYDRKVRRNFNF